MRITNKKHHVVGSTDEKESDKIIDTWRMTMTLMRAHLMNERNGRSMRRGRTSRDEKLQAKKEASWRSHQVKWWGVGAVDTGQRTFDGIWRNRFPVLLIMNLTLATVVLMKTRSHNVRGDPDQHSNYKSFNLSCVPVGAVHLRLSSID